MTLSFLQLTTWFLPVVIVQDKRTGTWLKDLHDVKSSIFWGVKKVTIVLHVYNLKIVYKQKSSLVNVFTDLQDTTFKSGGVRVVISRPTCDTFCVCFRLASCLQPKTTWTSRALDTTRSVPILHILAVINCRHLKFKKKNNDK